MTEFHFILPRPSRSHIVYDSLSSEQSKPVRTRYPIKAACEPCRQRKTKCDGTRPTCSTCIQKEEDNCHYGVEDGQTWSAAAKQQVQDLQNIIIELCRAPDKNVAIAIASRLQTHGFRNLKETASVLRDLVPVAKSSTHPSSSEDMQDCNEANYTTTALSSTATRDSLLQSSFLSGTADPKHLTIESPLNEAPQGSTPEAAMGELMIYSNPKKKSDTISEPLTVSAASKGRYWFVPRELVNHLDIYGIPTSLPEIPVHVVQITNSIDRRYISARYTDFVTRKRQLIENGCPEIDALGPSQTMLAQLLNTEVMCNENPRTVCEWAVALVQDIIDGMCLVEKLGTMLLITPLARWQISPTLEHYNGIPACMKPTPIQTMVLHPAWIDYIPWPDIRDYFINTPAILDDIDILYLITKFTHINWDKNQDSMITVNPTMNSLVLDAGFEAWTRNINNWFLDHAILSELPELVGKAWIKDNEQSGIQDDTQLFNDLVNHPWDPSFCSEAAVDMIP